MRYISWAVFYEGPSDALYLDVLLPRIIREVINDENGDIAEIPEVPAIRLGSGGKEREAVAKEACKFVDAFDILFIHADTGGRNLEGGLFDRSGAYCDAIQALCDFSRNYCITLTPRHETEAWLLADGKAVTDSLGFTGTSAALGLPQNAREAERLQDPKQTLKNAIETVAGRRRSQSVHNLFPAIAQRQDLQTLRGATSFEEFRTRLANALRTMKVI